MIPDTTRPPVKEALKVCLTDGAWSAKKGMPIWQSVVLPCRDNLSPRALRGAVWSEVLSLQGTTDCLAKARPSQRSGAFALVAACLGTTWGQAGKRTGVMQSVVLAQFIGPTGARSWRLTNETVGSREPDLWLCTETRLRRAGNGQRAKRTLGIGLASLCPQRFQRADQMNQETYNHYVYVVKSSRDGYIKVGRTKNVTVRVANIARNTDAELEVLKTYGFNASSDCATVEKYLHFLFKEFKSDTHTGSEWFTAEAEELIPESIDVAKATWHLIRYMPGFSKRVGSFYSHKEKTWVPMLRRPYL